MDESKQIATDRIQKCHEGGRKHLDLSGLKLPIFPDIRDLEWLEKLDLSNNQIRSIPKWIGELENLEVLNVSHNKLKRLNGNVGELKFLMNLNISNNNFTDIPLCLFNLNAIEKLDLSENILEILDSEVFEFLNIKELFLRKIGITSLDSRISNLSTLQVLDISNNDLVELPASLLDLNKLKTLDASQNQLSSFEMFQDSFPDLETLLLSDNCFEKVPKIREKVKVCLLENPVDELLYRIRENKKIYEWKKSFSEAKLIEVMAVLDRIEKTATEAILSAEEILNSFSSLRIPLNEHVENRVSGVVQQMENDKIFNNMDSQGETTLKAIFDIHSLHLRGKKMVKLDRVPKEVWEMDWLKTLDLSMNGLTSISSSVKNLSNLEVLSLADNKLEKLPAELQELKKLHSLDISGNEFQRLPTCGYIWNSLEVLNASNNKISVLSFHPMDLKELRILDVSRNFISELPKDLFALHLVELNLMKNRIKDISDEIGGLNKLENLELSKNELSELPEFILKSKSIKVLNLNSNKFKFFSFSTKYLRSIEKLRLRNNALLEKIGDDFGENHDIKEIDLRGSVMLKTLPSSVLRNSSIRVVLSKNKLKERLDYYKNLAEGKLINLLKVMKKEILSKKEQDVTVFLARLEGCKKRNTQGILTESDLRAEETKILYAILDFIDALTAEDLGITILEV